MVPHDLLTRADPPVTRGRFHSSNTVLRISSIPVVFEQFEKEREDLVDARQRWARGLKRAAIVDLKRELRENVTAYVSTPPTVDL
jgi:hypothetical protein